MFLFFWTKVGGRDEQEFFKKLDQEKVEERYKWLKGDSRDPAPSRKLLDATLH